jgi:hypothetical protein
MNMEPTECSETSAYKIQTPGNYLKEVIKHSEHGESLKSRIFVVIFTWDLFFNIEMSAEMHVRISLCRLSVVFVWF